MKPTSCVVIRHPRVEPVSLTEVKEHLRILPENAEDDHYVQGLIATARRLVESRLGITMVETQYRAKLCGHTGCGCSCGCGGIELPNPPLLVDDEHPVVISTPAGILDPDDFEVDADRYPAVIKPLRGFRGPATITYWAGLMPEDENQPTLKTAIMLAVGHLYKHREAVSSDVSMIVTPMAFDALLSAESYSGRW